jgi:hypothetical protein
MRIVNSSLLERLWRMLCMFGSSILIIVIYGCIVVLVAANGNHHTTSKNRIGSTISPHCHRKEKMMSFMVHIKFETIEPIKGCTPLLRL